MLTKILALSFLCWPDEVMFKPLNTNVYICMLVLSLSVRVLSMNFKDMSKGEGVKVGACEKGRGVGFGKIDVID